MALGPENAVPAPRGALSVALPEAVLLPGFVNVHTHLELTFLHGQAPEADFFDWIKRVRSAKGRVSTKALRAAVREGVHDAWRHGITTVADTGTAGPVAEELAELGGRGVVYQEVFGPHPAQADAAFRDLRCEVERLRRSISPTIRVGVSPHAPYTVSGELYQRVARFALDEGLPLAIHIAESPAEVELVCENRGPFAEAWRRRAVPPLHPTRSPIAYMAALGVLRARPLAIHAVQADHDDVALLAAHGCPVALCPGSNRRHGHGAPPVRPMIAANLTVGVGTDSVASVDSLDLLPNARSIRQLGGLSAAETIAVMTLGGAAALGLDEEIGSLTVGRWADLCAVRVGRRPPADPERMAQQVLDSRPEDILHTYVAGRMVHPLPDEPGARS